MNARWIRLLLIAVLVGSYGYRTWTGVWSGWAYDRSYVLRHAGDYDEAAPLAEAALIGSNTRLALLIAGDARLNEWDVQVREQGALGADSTELVQAAEDFLLCRCAAPAARRAWKGLADVYDSIEWIGRERRAENAYVVPEHPWARVGEPGRLAIGMLRATVEVSPNWARTHDSLALICWNYGLEELTRESVRESARVLPVYLRHPYHRNPDLPEWVDREFADASREVLGKVPFVSRSDHLVELGRLERRLGENERAISAFREVLEIGGDRLRIAEASFQLGLALIAEERWEEARTHLERALEHGTFRASALRSLARVAEHDGDYELALERLRKLRWELPEELWPCLEFASLARRVENWQAALEALRWAKLKHADEPEAYVALAETYVQISDVESAIAVAEELEALLGPEATEVVQLRRGIASAGGDSD